jgi:hypothetical protein
MTGTKESLLTPSADRARPEDEGRTHEPLKAQVMAEAMDPALGKLKEQGYALFEASVDTRGGISPTMSLMYKGISNQEVLVQRLGVWAGILFEHPVSDEYALAHPIPSPGYTAEGLAELEQALDEAKLTLRLEEFSRYESVEKKRHKLESFITETSSILDDVRDGRASD